MSPPSPQPTPSPPSSEWPPTLLSDLTSPRSRRQLSLLLGGCAFFLASTFITRRSLARRHLSTRPLFYQPSNAPPRLPVNGAMEALEALNLATLHVASAGMMLVGGGLWVFDIGSMAELRGRFRAAIGVEDREDKGADEEMEEWLATVLKRKEGKEKRRSKDGEEEEGR